jgi:hypothetical protein
MKKQFLMAMAVGLFTACEKPIVGEVDDGNVTLEFVPTTADVQTRGTVVIGDYFSKLNIQIFTEAGEKVFSTVKTQTRDGENFGTLNVQLEPGTYTVVAVGHSSIKSATIKSPELVQFTASNGEKLTDTFCHCSTVTITDDGGMHELRMNRVTAMVRLRLTDEEIPAAMEHLKIDYTGGSANFNPTTSEGCTKSKQSEMRLPASEYQVFTFPYLSKNGTLKMTLTALDDAGNNIRQKVISDVPVTRNRITTYNGTLFGEDCGTITQTGFGITIDGEWDGEDEYTF